MGVVEGSVCGCDGLSVSLFFVPCRLVCRWGGVVNGGADSGVVVPVDPLGGSEFYIGQVSPVWLWFDEFGFVQTDRRFHQGVVQGVAYRSDGGVDSGCGEVLGEPQTCVLASGVAVMEQTRADRGADTAAVPGGHVEGVQNQFRVARFLDHRALSLLQRPPPPS